eukprot:TRINITY_DN11294_c0_g1_i1.p1 TRINITY_DN11294_c0_g1~~TRINITY_DN11294_c0_g1_i1.p1  ORF type:complete len:120 (-),score=21.63 TRINITY_DN11294_c0_g1_i1:116-475(-)
MGSYKGKYNMKDDTAKFHEDVQSVQLQYLHGTDEEETNAGSISFRVFLNVVQMYQDHGLHYIDSEHADKKLQIFKTELRSSTGVGWCNCCVSNVKYVEKCVGFRGIFVFVLFFACYIVY